MAGEWRNAHGMTMEEVRALGSEPETAESEQEVRAANGLSEAEDRVMRALCDAANAYAQLEVEHPSEQLDFAMAIHRCQDLLAGRIARRAFPQGWPKR